MKTYRSIQISSSVSWWLLAAPLLVSRSIFIFSLPSWSSLLPLQIITTRFQIQTSTSWGVAVLDRPLGGAMQVKLMHTILILGFYQVFFTHMSQYSPTTSCNPDADNCFSTTSAVRVVLLLVSSPLEEAGTE